ncbi:MAG: GAF domain-containing protein, partial [Anaerolineae bacterium]
MNKLAPQANSERDYLCEPFTGKDAHCGHGQGFLRRQVEAVDALQATAIDLACHDPLASLKAIARDVVTPLDADASAIYALDPGGSELRCVASYNLWDCSETLQRIRETVRSVVQTSARPTRTQEGGADRLRQEAARDAKAAPVLALPLYSQGVVNGVLLILRRPGRLPFTEDDLALLRLFGSFASLVIQNGQLDERVQLEIAERERVESQIEERRRADQIQGLLYRIASAAQATRDEPVLFSAIRHELGAVLDTTNFFVALYDRKTDAITLSHFVDEKDHFETFPAGKTLTAMVIRQGRPLCVTRPEIETMIEAGTIELVGTPAAVWLGVPLEVSGEVIGALVVQSYTDESAFGPEEQEFLGFVSSQIGLAAERVRAEQELRRLKEFHESIVQNMA